MQIRKYVFTASLTVASRFTLVRDLLLGRIGPVARNSRARKLWFGSVSEVEEARSAIHSGNNILDVYFVKPATSQVRAVVLICHGIGETVEHWHPVQRLFAANGVATLVFDYSGYGRSTGWASGSQCERDAITAFEHLQGLMPGYPVTLLGYSMGSGIAAAIVRRVNTDRLILCAGFTSFRKAAQSIGFPKFLAMTLPDLWHADENLRDYRAPVLIVHGERDELFPVAMAQELASYGESELVVVPGMTHNEPFYAPDIAYWGLILSRLMAKQTGEDVPDLVVETLGGNTKTHSQSK
jgi:pimeloyl-ACP methyl ester carboxylesterase